jgi:signal transduction histidine kinase
MPIVPSADTPPGSLQPHAGALRQRLFAPLNIAAYVTWLVITLQVIEPAALARHDPGEWAGLCALVAFIGVFAACASSSPRATTARLATGLVVESALLLLAETLLMGGQTAVLLILLTVQAIGILPMRVALGFLVALNLAFASLWLAHGNPLARTVLSLLSIIGFEVFAGLTSHYAQSREQAREHLAQVNAELMATRLLLEESARAGERLKLSRELHDVAGHSLTALKLNLARLARDPALADREEVRVSTALADDLLAQIRQVVGALRAHDGVDLRAAFEALVRPMPGVHIGIEIEDGLRVDDIDRAETLLRCAQEAITNALRHGRAGRIDLRLQRIDDGLQLRVDNDGVAPTDLRPGNGLTGMRERVEALGGTLAFAPTPPRGLRVTVTLPERAS